MGKFGEIHSADTRAGKFPLVSMGAERSVPRARTRERGPPSALAEIVNVLLFKLLLFKNWLLYYILRQVININLQ